MSTYLPESSSQGIMPENEQYEHQYRLTAKELFLTASNFDLEQQQFEFYVTCDENNQRNLKIGPGQQFQQNDQTIITFKDEYSNELTWNTISPINNKLSGEITSRSERTQLKDPPPELKFTVECYDGKERKMRTVGHAKCDLESFVDIQNKQVILFLTMTPEMQPIIKHACLSFNMSITKNKEMEEKSPCGRFIKENLLSKSEEIQQFEGLDTKTDSLIVWNIIKLDNNEKIVQATMNYFKKMMEIDSEENLFNLISVWESEQKSRQYVLITQKNSNSLYSMEKAPEVVQSLDKVKQWSKSILRALVSLRQENVLHSKIITNNVFIESENNVKIDTLETLVKPLIGQEEKQMYSEEQELANFGLILMNLITKESIEMSQVEEDVDKVLDKIANDDRIDGQAKYLITQCLTRKTSLENMVSNVFFTVVDLKFWSKFPRVGHDDSKQQSAVIDNYMKKFKEEKRLKLTPNNFDLTRFVGQIQSQFEVPNSDGVIQYESCLGTGTIYHQITERHFIIVTCAHNFMIFKLISKLNEQMRPELVDGAIQASSLSTFYLQRHDQDFKMEMKITEAVVHPNYVEEGKDLMFTNGTDVAFAVVEIPADKWRAIPSKAKEELQKLFDDLPEPQPFDHKKLVANKNDVGVVAGYPMNTLNVNEKGDILHPPSENFIWADFGHISPKSLVAGSTLLCYEENNLVTSAGQSGSVLQLITKPPQSMQNKVNGVVQEITPQKSKEVLKNNLENLKTTIIGVHVGIKDKLNYANIFDENLCLDFMFPTMIEFHKIYGKQFNNGPKINPKFKKSIDAIEAKYKTKMNSRKAQKEILDRKRMEAKKKMLSQEHEQIEKNEQRKKINECFREIVETKDLTQKQSLKRETFAKSLTNQEHIEQTEIALKQRQIQISSLKDKKVAFEKFIQSFSTRKNKMSILKQCPDLTKHKKVGKFTEYFSLSEDQRRKALDFIFIKNHNTVLKKELVSLAKDLNECNQDIYDLCTLFSTFISFDREVESQITKHPIHYIDTLKSITLSAHGLTSKLKPLNIKSLLGSGIMTLSRETIYDQNGKAKQKDKLLPFQNIITQIDSQDDADSQVSKQIGVKILQGQVNVLENRKKILFGIGRITCIMNPKEKSYIEEGEFDKTGKLIVGRKINWKGQQKFIPETLGGKFWSEYLTNFENEIHQNSNEATLKILKQQDLDKIDSMIVRNEITKELELILSKMNMNKDENVTILQQKLNSSEEWRITKHQMTEIEGRWKEFGQLDLKQMIIDSFTKLQTDDKNYLIPIQSWSDLLQGNQFIELYTGQSMDKSQLNGLGRKTVLACQPGQNSKIFEGFFSKSDGELEFGRVIELETYKIGWFQNGVLHGQGKIIEPNEFIIDGYFDNGKHTQKEIKSELISDIEIARRINWNDYISIAQHYEILNQAINDEDQSDKRYKDILRIVSTMKKGRSELNQLKNKKVLLMIGAEGIGKSTLASAFIKGTDAIIGQNGKFSLDDPIIHNHDLKFQINQGNIRQGKSVEVFPVDQEKDIFLVESTISSNKNTMNEIPLHSSIQYIMNNCSQLKIFVILNAADLCIERGGSMIESLTRFMRIIPKPLLQNQQLNQLIIPLLVRFQVFHTEEECNAKFEAIRRLYIEKIKKQNNPKGNEDDGSFDQEQYPQPEEMELFLNLLTMIMSNYTFIHPKDFNPDQMEKFSKCSDVLKTQQSQFGTNKQINSSQLYQLDVHDSLSKDLHTIFIDKLEKLTSYQTDNNIRNSFKFLFCEMISEWSGPNKQKLIQDLDMVKIRVGYKFLEWYLDEINDRIRSNIVKKELGQIDVSKMPMTKYLFKVMKSLQKCEESDKFNFNDWAVSLQFLKETAKLDPNIKKRQCKPSPDSQSNQNIQFDQAIDEMIIYSKTIQAKTKESSEESRNAMFVIGILERQVKSEILKDFEQLLPRVYEQRQNKQLMNFAAEYFLQSVEVKEELEQLKSKDMETKKIEINMSLFKQTTDNTLSKLILVQQQDPKYMRLKVQMDDKQEDIINLIDLFNSRPNFSHHCKDSQISDDTINFLKEFSKHFCTVHHGFMNLYSLLEDTLIRASTRKDQKTIIPFKLSVFKDQKNLIIRCGQIQAKNNRDMVMDGIGRMIYLKLKNTQNERLELDPKSCYIQEGEFKADKLKGFGRIVRGNQKSDKIGFMESSNLHGYGKSISKDSPVQLGLFDKNEYRPDQSSQKLPYSLEEDICAQKIEFEAYVINFTQQELDASDSNINRFFEKTEDDWRAQQAKLVQQQSKPEKPKEDGHEERLSTDSLAPSKNDGPKVEQSVDIVDAGDIDIEIEVGVEVEAKAEAVLQLVGDEKQCKYLNHLNFRMDNDVKNLKELIGKHVCVLFGTTGTGKSTLANSIIQGKDQIYIDEKGLFQVRQDLKYANETVFKIGHEVKSETRAPKFYKYNSNQYQDIYLVDGPGINDSNLRNEYANQTAIKQVLMDSEAFTLLLVIDANQVNLVRGRTFIELITSVLRKFHKSAWNKSYLSSVILPYIVNFNTVENKKLLDENLGNLKELFMKKLNVFESERKKYQKKQQLFDEDDRIDESESSDEIIDQDTQEALNKYMITKKLPSLGELKGVIMLLDIIIQNFKFVHPLDHNPRQMQSFIPTSMIMKKNEDLLLSKQADHATRINLPNEPAKVAETHAKGNNWDDRLEKDINLSLFAQMQRQFVENVLQVSSFVENAQTRKVYTEIFGRILRYWDGNFKECLLGSLDAKARQVMTSSIPQVKWYRQDILPVLSKLAAKSLGLQESPINSFFYQFIGETSKFNEKAEFVLGDWEPFLRLLEQNLSTSRETVKFRSCDLQNSKKIELKDVCSQLQECIGQIKTESIGTSNINNQDQVEDQSYTMAVLLKDSTLKLFKNLAPKLFDYRFEEDQVKQFATNYLAGKKNILYDGEFDDAVSIESLSESEDNEEDKEEEVEEEEEEEDIKDLVCYLPTKDAIKQINFTSKSWIKTTIKQNGILLNKYSMLISGPQEQLYMIGGNNNRASDKMYSIEKREFEGKSIQYKFIEKTNLNEKRFIHSLCWYDQQKYIVISGGYKLSSCELYNIEEDKITQLPPLNTFRRLHPSISISDTIYVFCGNDGNFLNTIEKLYKPLEQESKWRVVEIASSQQLTACQNPGVIQLDQSNKLLVFGGSGKTQSFMFDTEKSELTPTKTQLPEKADFINNKVVQDRNTNSVYCVNGVGNMFFQYDILNEQWTKIELQEIKQE